MAKPSKRKYLQTFLERSLSIQSQSPQPESFASLILWLQDKLEQNSQRKQKTKKR